MENEYHTGTSIFLSRNTPARKNWYLKRSRRVKYMRLRVHAGGVVVLTVPFFSEARAIDRFVAKQARWLKWAIGKMVQYKALPVEGRRDYLKHKETARRFLHERVTYWNRKFNYHFRRIAIKNTSRTWGSCSRKGNLNFSYSLLFLPRMLADYIVVHELCHLAHPNHSRQFWMEVARAMPDFEARRCELKRYLPRM